MGSASSDQAPNTGRGLWASFNWCTVTSTPPPLDQPTLHTKHMSGTIPRRQDLEAISCNVCPSCQDVGIGKHETSISVPPCVSTLSQLADTHVTSSPRASPLHLRSANHESWRRQGPRNKAVNVTLKWHVMALGKRPSHTRSRSWH